MPLAGVSPNLVVAAPKLVVAAPKPLVVDGDFTSGFTSRVGNAADTASPNPNRLFSASFLGAPRVADRELNADLTPPTGTAGDVVGLAGGELATAVSFAPPDAVTSGFGNTAVAERVFSMGVALFGEGFNIFAPKPVKANDEDEASEELSSRLLNAMGLMVGVVEERIFGGFAGVETAAKDSVPAAFGVSTSSPSTSFSGAFDSLLRLCWDYYHQVY